MMEHWFMLNHLPRNIIRLLLLLMANWQAANAQPITDSLQTVLNRSEDTARVRILVDLSRQYQKEKNRELTFQYANDAVTLSWKIGNHPVIYNAYIHLGRLYENELKYDSAIIVYTEALALAERNKALAVIADLRTKIGVKYDYLLDWEKAIQNHLAAQALFTQVNDTIGLIRSHINLYGVYQNMKDAPTSKHHIEQAYLLSEKTSNTEAKGYSSLNLGSFYSDANEPDSSIKYSRKALKYWTELGRHERIAQCLNNLGIQLVKKGQYAEGIATIQQANEIKIKHRYTRDLSNGYLALGKAYLHAGNRTAAEQWLRKGIALSDSLEIAPDDYIAALRDLSVLLFDKKEWKEAWEVLAKYADRNDSLYSTERRKAIAEVEVRYESEKKEQLIATLNKEKEAKQRFIYLIISIAVLLMALLVVLYMVFNTRRKYYQQFEKVQQLKVLLSQINPHFLFNTLNSIYSLSLSRSDKTPGILLRLSGLMRYMLESSGKSQVALADEVACLENYIALEKIRLPEEARITFHQQGSFGDVLLPPMLFLPFVENGFKHGDNGMYTTLQMDISLVRQDDFIYFEIENNKPPVGKELVSTTRTGLDNIRKRLDILFKNRHTLEISNEPAAFKVKLTLQL